MLPSVILFLLLLLVIIYIWGHPLLTHYYHQQITKTPFPPLWQEILERRSPLYSHLPQPLQQRLQGKIQIFLNAKQFMGCQGLVITEEMRLVIAAQACLLSLNQPDSHYPQLNTILVYPQIFQVKRPAAIDEYLVEEQSLIVSGESWGKQGQVVLAWETICRDLDDWQDGHNLIFHEFAHQLDQADGTMNGVPKLPTQADYQQWARVCSQEYQQLLSQLEHGLKTIIDPYGATNPAEFFAVITETFLENAAALQQHHPELYQILKQYYQLDPMLWLS